MTVLWLRFLRLWKGVLLVATLATFGAVLCFKLGWLGISDAETGAYDQGLKFFTYGPLAGVFSPPVRPSSQVMLVAVDDRSFQEIRQNPSYARTFGTWPYSRNIWARLIEHLDAQKASAIVFDMVMDEPHTDPAGDLALREAIAAAAVPVYLGFSVSAGDASRESARRLPKVEATNVLPGPESPAEVTAPAHSADSVEPPQGESFEDEPEDPAGPPAEVSAQQIAQALAFPVRNSELILPRLMDSDRPQHPNPPISPLLDVVAGFGLVKHEEDDDGKIRRTRFAYSDGSNTYVTLATAAAADLLGARELALAPRSLTLGTRTFAVGADGSAEIDYGGKLEDRFAQVSLVSVLNDWALARSDSPLRLPADTFRGKVVVVAGFAAGTYDVKATPFTSASPGAVKVAAELQNFLDGRFIVEEPFVLSLLLTFAVALFSASIILIIKSTVVELGWPLLLFFGFFIVTGSMLVSAHSHLLSAMPMMAGEFASVASVAFNHLLANKDREYLREAFSRYMERSLVDQMVEGRRLPELSGENMEVTAFFSDIRGFSSFSETFRDDPATLVRVMNTYLTRVTAVLVAHGACIDKYIGDAVVCLFGAPVPFKNHAVRACRAALAVCGEIDRLREEFRAQGLPDVYTRIGLNSGEMLVGNIGSEQLLDYTAIGDGMNLAARLEGANKAYGTTIMLGEGTYQLAQAEIEVRELDLVRVAGKKVPARVFELLSLKGQLTPEKRQLVRQYEAALQLYRQKQFAQAAELLAPATSDGPSKVLYERCLGLIESPPEADFDGVVNLEK